MKRKQKITPIDIDIEALVAEMLGDGKLVAALIKKQFEQAKQIGEHLGRIRELQKPLNDNLTMHGFFLFPYLDDFDVKDIDQLAYFSKDELADYFISTFSENNFWHLKNLFLQHQGSQFHLERQALFSDCLKAHSQNMFGLTVPTILPIIENLILRLLGCPESPYTVRQTLVKEDKKAAFSGQLQQVDKLNGLLFERFVLEIFQVKNENENILMHRNAILHGYDRDYATEINSLFLFFVLNFLFEMELAMPKLRLTA